jgi:histidinol-phosphate phosphatase family protein
MADSLRRCVFFDRDGIVNVSPGPGAYVLDWAGFEFEPAFPGILRRVIEKGYVAVVVTNQRGVALGLITQAALDDIHTRMRQALKERHGLELLDVMVCPHEKGVCTCRKPSPGMLLTAAKQHGLDLAASWMIGDHERDVEAGRRAGCRTILVDAGTEKTAADVRVASMDALSVWIDRDL